jgi:hypothetical protein
MIIDLNDEEIIVLLGIIDTSEENRVLENVREKLKEALYGAYENDATGFKR